MALRSAFIRPVAVKVAALVCGAVRPAICAVDAR